MVKPRVAIVGKGNVGSALAEALQGKGYAVEAVGKEPQKVREVAQKADVIVLAVPYGERENAVRELGDAVNGKVLVDVTNAIGPNMEFGHDLRRSGAEELQEKARGARVVKAFNTVFADTMRTGKANGEKISVLFAGDDAKARDTVRQLAHDIGFDAVDAGPLRNAMWLETLGYLNIQLGYGQNLGSNTGFRFVHAEQPAARGEESAAEAR